MTNNWFECKVKYVKIDEVSGKERKASESYLVDAVSFTEAEARIHKELEQMISGEFNVTNISKSNVTELYPNENGDRWFKAKVTFVDVDEASGKEKKATQYMLTEATNVKQAYEFLEECLSDMIVPYEIPAISASPLMDVFPFFSENDNEEIPEHLKPISEMDVNSGEFE
ncbi:DUF4494 domain-containing protein [Labilibaculum sp.]|uniref:DUF4494 domain-containing protein n=1 Tax=Labilibaculum sp. TaxID=2060723 RepID=UPI0035669D96